MNEQRNTGLMRRPERGGAAHQHRAVKREVQERYWPSTVMGVGVFVALVSALTVLPWSLVSPAFLLRFFVGLCFVGNLLPYARSGLRLGMARLEWFLFNLIAIGPVGTSLLLWINFLFHGTPTVSDHIVSAVESNGTVITYEFRDGYLTDHWMARSTYADWYPIIGNAVEFTTAPGLFGIGVVLRKEPHVVG